ncbi:hypothetical protein A2291_06195 [candidate division WOR-1 bacterium RIFOXYB2_FULL_42_35]|uniref:Uncharacterized protein n=1 Tax=candidate division WOR-1 bacterium RIFOXYC2_FULL_41_25 TaxID=1802586 RepID=A0A1F4TRB6_UNCSA|nr:MAG: hypothetical protein A2247_04075 [candidate division WOR-1 bacterium RIFOXYA2_FULL_41_14]OGC24978.1 MAG: hypothetical protein A2291_06195 [candidate division WOR-1 bacterium RIFOXYB2_FULL_42_35]OGC35177.1 MAG: hypothetical protein A2462_02150 [candidate division WOR-1 bacterium RIFOXYC2_FULL_41_25]OGC42376.1 MAG: hypothetical protein A2548_05950 [candidate division WOR-1 bacterium RIFOXYD2_FULL_41_8]
MAGFTVISGKGPRFTSLADAVYILSRRWRGFAKEAVQWAEGTLEERALDTKMYEHEVEMQDFIHELHGEPDFQALPLVSERSKISPKALIVDSRDLTKGLGVSNHIRT